MIMRVNKTIDLLRKFTVGYIRKDLFFKLASLCSGGSSFSLGLCFLQREIRISLALIRSIDHKSSFSPRSVPLHHNFENQPKNQAHIKNK